MSVTRLCRNRIFRNTILTSDIRLRRSGAISAMVIVVLLVLTGLVGSQVRRVLFERRQARNETEYVQAQRLADAGILAARSIIRSHSEFGSTSAWPAVTWNVPPGAVHQTNSATVSITADDDRLITVVARYPSNSDTPFQVTRIMRLLND